MARGGLGVVSAVAARAAAGGDHDEVEAVTLGDVVRAVPPPPQVHHLQYERGGLLHTMPRRGTPSRALDLVGGQRSLVRIWAASPRGRAGGRTCTSAAGGLPTPTRRSQALRQAARGGRRATRRPDHVAAEGEPARLERVRAEADVERDVRVVLVCGRVSKGCGGVGVWSWTRSTPCACPGRDPQWACTTRQSCGGRQESGPRRGTRRVPAARWQPATCSATCAAQSR